MFIHEMTRAECRKALEQAGLGRLACARNNRPYVVPTYFAFDGKHVYGFTTLGQKIEWMRTNAHVCLEIDELTSHDKWMSVIVFGRYEELPDKPQYKAARTEAHHLLERRAMWWEPAYIAKAHRETPHSLTPIYYRIHIDRMTGHRISPDQADISASMIAPATAKESRWGSLLRHMRLT